MPLSVDPCNARNSDSKHRSISSISYSCTSYRWTENRSTSQVYSPMYVVGTGVGGRVYSSASARVVTFLITLSSSPCAILHMRAAGAAGNFQRIPRPLMSSSHTSWSSSRVGWAQSRYFASSRFSSSPPGRHQRRSCSGPYRIAPRGAHGSQCAFGKQPTSFVQHLVVNHVLTDLSGNFEESPQYGSIFRKGLQPIVSKLLPSGASVRI